MLQTLFFIKLNEIRAKRSKKRHRKLQKGSGTASSFQKAVPFPLKNCSYEINVSAASFK